MSRKIFKLVAWGSLVFIVFATLSPIGLRPHVTSVNLERFGAFVMAGLLFGLAYPNRFWLVLTIVVGAAGVLEVLQVLTPDRHGEASNAFVKIAGGGFGVGVAALIHRLWIMMSLPPEIDVQVGPDTT
jgi:apolipoprotein N-acyltransferase